MKDIKLFLKQKKKKSDNMIANDRKIYKKMKNKGLSSTETNIVK